MLAEAQKPPRTADTVAFLACTAIVYNILGPQAAKEIAKIPLSNCTIGRRINDTSADIEDEVFGIISGGTFAFQVDESTNVSGHASLLENV